MKGTLVGAVLAALIASSLTACGGHSTASHAASDCPIVNRNMVVPLTTCAGDDFKLEAVLESIEAVSGTPVTREQFLSVMTSRNYVCKLHTTDGTSPDLLPVIEKSC